MAKLNKQAKSLIIAGSVILLLLAVLFILLPLLPSFREEGGSSSNSTSLVTLLEQSVDNIQSIKVENENGGFTVQRISDENFDVPELKGFSLIQDNVNYLPEAVSVLKTTKIAEENPEDLSIFGLDVPRAKAEYTFTDGSSFVLELGSQVTGASNYYAKIEGKSEVYVLTGSLVGYFFVPKEDFVSRTLLATVEEVYPDQSFTSDSMLFDEITLSGTHVPAQVTVTQLTDTTGMSQAMIESYKYNVTDGTKTALFHTGIASQFYENFFGITADDVIKALPSPEDLELYGLSDPYCTVSLNAGGVRTTLSCSAKDEEGYYYVMKKGYNVIYKVAADKLFWAEYTYADMATSLLYAPYIYDVKSISLEFETGENYTFEANTPEVSEDLVVTSDGQVLDNAQYRKFYELLIYSTKEMELTGEEDLSAEPKLTITFTRKEGNKDVIRLIPVSVRSVAFELNGTAEYAMRGEFVNKILRECGHLLNGETVTSDW